MKSKIKVGNLYSLSSTLNKYKTEETNVVMSIHSQTSLLLKSISSKYHESYVQSDINRIQRRLNVLLRLQHSKEDLMNEKIQSLKIASRMYSSLDSTISSNIKKGLKTPRININRLLNLQIQNNLPGNFTNLNIKYDWNEPKTVKTESVGPRIAPEKSSSFMDLETFRLINNTPQIQPVATKDMSISRNFSQSNGTQDIENKSFFDWVDSIFKSDEARYMDGHTIEGKNICIAYVEDIDDCYYYDDRGEKRFKGYYTSENNVMIDERGLYPITGWVVEHEFEYIGLSVFETNRSENGFNISAVGAKEAKPMIFYPEGYDVPITTIEGLQQLNYDHRNEDTWNWVKVGINITADSITLYTLGAAGPEAVTAKQAILGFMKKFLIPGKSTIISQTVTNAGDMLSSAEFPVDSISDAAIWGASWLPIVGSAMAIYDATSDDPIKGVFVEMPEGTTFSS